jgi:hypothetical protein
VREQDILPLAGGQVAALPIDSMGNVEAIALGNYANDHHYPGYEFVLQSKSLRWGGRWTGTPFTVPYRALIPVNTDGLLVCEKNISVSHIANGATRLQPIVLNIGQAAGMAAALCVERGCQPRELHVHLLQTALLQDPMAPAAIIPFFNLSPDHPQWYKWQHHYLHHPGRYPNDGHCPLSNSVTSQTVFSNLLTDFIGKFTGQGEQDYLLTLTAPIQWAGQTFNLVTLNAQVNEQLQAFESGQLLQVVGRINPSGHWLLVEQIEKIEPDGKRSISEL